MDHKFILLSRSFNKPVSPSASQLANGWRRVNYWVIMERVLYRIYLLGLTQTLVEQIGLSELLSQSYQVSLVTNFGFHYVIIDSGASGVDCGRVSCEEIQVRLREEWRATCQPGATPGTSPASRLLLTMERCGMCVGHPHCPSQHWYRALFKKFLKIWKISCHLINNLENTDTWALKQAGEINIIIFIIL